MAVTIASARRRQSQGKNIQRVVETLDSVPDDLLSSRLGREMVDRGEEAELVKQSAFSVIDRPRPEITHTNPSRLLVIVPSISK